MKLKILITISVTLILVVLISNRHTYKTQNPDDYISFTTFYLLNNNEANDEDELGATIYEYNLQSKEISEIFSFPQNTFYALGVYDKKTNSVYYTKEKNNNSFKRQGTGDQIYVYNLKTGSDTMLTKDLFAVNYIVPVDGAVFFIAVKLDSGPGGLILGKIDLSNGSVTYWDEPDEAATRTISVDKINKRIYVAIYDTEEEHILMQRDVNEHATPEYTIYSFDYNLSDKREILHIDNVVIKSLYVMDNLLLYRAHDTMGFLPDTTTVTEVIDLNDMKVLYQSDEQFTERGSFARDKKGVYILDEGISYYDFETQDYTPLLRSDFGRVLNFQLMYQN